MAKNGHNFYPSDIYILYNVILDILPFECGACSPTLWIWAGLMIWIQENSPCAQFEQISRGFSLSEVGLSDPHLRPFLIKKKKKGSDLCIQQSMVEENASDLGYIRAF